MYQLNSTHHVPGVVPSTLYLLSLTNIKSLSPHNDRCYFLEILLSPF